MSNSLTIRDWVESGDEALIQRALKAHLDKENQGKWDHLLATEHGITRSTAKRRKLRSWRQAVAVAASIALILAITFLLVQGGPEPVELAVNMIETESIMHPGSSKGELTGETVSPEDIVAFNSGEYSAYISSAESGSLNSLYDQYYLALAYMKEGNYDKATELFQALSRDPGTLRQEVRWYHAISAIAGGDIESGRKLLTSIQPEEWKYADAQAMLKSIEKSNYVN